MIQEFSYGVLPIYKKGDEYRILIIQHIKGNWGYPKGRADADDKSNVESALRELREETGISECDLRSEYIFKEQYEKVRHSVVLMKEALYYLGFVNKDDIVMQEEEIADYKWATFEEAKKLLTFETRKRILKEVEDLLVNSKII